MAIILLIFKKKIFSFISKGIYWEKSKCKLNKETTQRLSSWEDWDNKGSTEYI